ECLSEKSRRCIYLVATIGDNVIHTFGVLAERPCSDCCLDHLLLPLLGGDVCQVQRPVVGCGEEASRDTLRKVVHRDRCCSSILTRKCDHVGDTLNCRNRGLHVNASVSELGEGRSHVCQIVNGQVSIGVKLIEILTDGLDRLASGVHDGLN